MTSRGRAIDPNPVLSLLLERRSVIITSGSLYKEHLHSIEGVVDDRILPALSSENTIDGSRTSPKNKDGVRIDNWNLLSNNKMKEIAENGGQITRETRVSLTCRDVEKVRKMPLIGGVKGLGK